MQPSQSPQAGADSEAVAAEVSPEILRHDILKYQRHGTEGGLVFFDRGVVDALGMIVEAERLQDTQRNGLLGAYAYHHQVFVLPPWEAIYVTDAERDQSFAEAVAVHRRVTRWYRLCDYTLIEVPWLTVAERCAYVLRELGREDT